MRCRDLIGSLSLSLSFVFSLAPAAFASGKIYYGSRAGMTVTVISMSGLDTSHAVIRTAHNREDAVAFCREYIGNVTEACIREELEQPLNDLITANCLTGEFVDFFGNHHRFLGANKTNNSGLSVKYKIQNLASGQIADGTSASGYFTNMGIYKALCPVKAPSDYN